MHIHTSYIYMPALVFLNTVIYFFSSRILTNFPAILYYPWVYFHCLLGSLLCPCKVDNQVHILKLWPLGRYFLSLFFKANRYVSILQSLLILPYTLIPRQTINKPKIILFHLVVDSHRHEMRKRSECNSDGYLVTQTCCTWVWLVYSVTRYNAFQKSHFTCVSAMAWGRVR